MFSVEDFAESFKTLSDDELSNMLIAVMRERSAREQAALKKDEKYYYFDSPNKADKVVRNAKSLADMGRTINGAPKK